jgi:YihY family inner membrane protein
MAPEVPPASTTEKNKQKKSAPKIVQKVAQKVQPLQAFFTKFNNDWVTTLAAGLAFSILTAIFPMVIAIVSLVGLVLGALDPAAKTQLLTTLSTLFPETLSANGQNVLAPVINSLSKDAGLLGIFAILTSVFGGSRLFITLEGYFDIIYHTRPRNFIPQNVMALAMMVVFLVLVPLMVFGGAVPALVLSLLKMTPLGSIPHLDLLFSLGGLLLGCLLAWALFLVIYMVVPNQPISLRKSWLGSLVAALLVQLYLTLFPFYVTHFLGTYTGSAGAAGFAVILVFFLYYFSIILLLGAEINAYFGEQIRATPASIPTMIHTLTSHLSTSETAVEQQAAIGHKDEKPKEILTKEEVEQLEEQASSKTPPNATEEPTILARMQE